MTAASSQAGDPAVPITPGQARDREIASLYLAHRGKVRRTLMVLGCSGHDADDVVQETILAIREHWERVRDLEKPEAYWYKAAIRRWRRAAGSRARRLASGDQHEYLLSLPDPDDAFAAADQQRAVEAAVRELPPRQGQVLWLRLTLGFSEAETAEILGISAGTAKRHLHDARHRMCELLRKQGDSREARIR